jgi:hypothetical protein
MEFVMRALMTHRSRTGRLPRTFVRRAIAAIGTSTIAVVATIAFAVPPAHAAASGHFLAKGTGSAYSLYNVVNLGVVPGGTTKTFYFKFVNTSSTAQNFRATMTTWGGAGLTATLYQGYKAVPAEFVTPTIAPGKTLAFKVKVKLASGTPQGTYQAYLAMRDPVTNVIIGDVYADVFATNQTGTTRHDLFLKTGSQPYVGGSSPQFETASTLRVGNTATFVLRMKNDGATPAAISLTGGRNFYYCPSNFSITIKQGSQNVTAAVQAGSYSTGTLAPGAKKELKVSIKLLSATTCLTAYYAFTASGPDGDITQSGDVIVGV